MSLKSTETRYGSVAIAIHWASALGVIAALATGLVAAGAADPAAQLAVVRWHVVIGLSVFALTLLRILWWLLADKRPQPVAGQPRWQEMAARIVHGLVYVVILLMATSGIASLVAAGAIPALLGGQGLPDLDAIIPRIAHGIMSKLLITLLVMHVGAAMYHQFIRRDRLLGRMGIGAV
jgi:cytochrome b561